MNNISFIFEKLSVIPSFIRLCSAEMRHVSCQKSCLFRSFLVLLNFNLFIFIFLIVTLFYKDDVRQRFYPPRREMTEKEISQLCFSSSKNNITRANATRTIANTTRTNTSHFSISKKVTASTPQYFLVILVLSTGTAKGLEQRDSIRQSWMKGYRKKNPLILVQFSIGTANLNLSDVEKLKIEQEKYGDLLLLNVQDLYSNLAKKVLMSLVELDNYYSFSYLMKCDDDTFIALDKLLRELKERDPTKSLYWGKHLNRGKVFRDGKWKEDNWFLCSTYLPFAVGAGYVLTSNLVKKVTSNADGLILYENEDTSMGAWLSPYKMERRDDNRFKPFPQKIDCQNDLVIHYQYRKDMLGRQKSLDERGSVCKA